MLEGIRLRSKGATLKWQKVPVPRTFRTESTRATLGLDALLRQCVHERVGSFFRQSRLGFSQSLIAFVAFAA